MYKQLIDCKMLQNLTMIFFPFFFFFRYFAIKDCKFCYYKSFEVSFAKYWNKGYFLVILFFSFKNINYLINFMFFLLLLIP